MVRDIIELEKEVETSLYMILNSLLAAKYDGVTEYTFGKYKIQFTTHNGYFRLICVTNLETERFCYYSSDMLGFIRFIIMDDLEEQLKNEAERLSLLHM